MVHRDKIWTALEEWSPVTFLAGGVLFALPAVATGVTAVTGTEVAVSPAVVFAFMLVVFVGLLGLYPGLAERNAGLAKGCLGLLAGTATITIPAVGVFAPSTAVPVGEAAALATVVTVAVGFTLTVTAFGVGTLRTGTRPRPVGGFLLVVAASVSSMILAMLVYGHSTPAWVGGVVNGLIATSLVSIGAVLWAGTFPAETTDSAGDATAS